MDYTEMFDAIRERTEGFTGGAVAMGLPGPGPGVSLAPIAEGISTAYYSRRLNHDATLAVYVKAPTQREAMRQAHAIGEAWTKARALPRGASWAVIRMQARGPVFVDREDSTGLWLYVNNVDILYTNE